MTTILFNGKEYDSDITELDLSNSDLSNLNGIEQFTKLKELYLHNNKIIDISPLSNLVNLRLLTLDYNQIKDISPLSKLINLEYLYLDYNQISDISSIGNLIKLKHLNLKRNIITDFLPIGNLINLKETVITLVDVENMNSEEFNTFIKNNIKNIGDEITLNHFNGDMWVLSMCKEMYLDNFDITVIKLSDVISIPNSDKIDTLMSRYFDPSIMSVDITDEIRRVFINHSYSIKYTASLGDLAYKQGLVVEGKFYQYKSNVFSLIVDKNGSLIYDFNFNVNNVNGITLNKTKEIDLANKIVRLLNDNL